MSPSEYWQQAQKKDTLMNIFCIAFLILFPLTHLSVSYAATTTPPTTTPPTTTPPTTTPPAVKAVPLAAVAPAAVIVSINGNSYKINGSAKQGAATTAANVPARVEFLDGANVKCSAPVSGVNTSTRYNCSYAGTYTAGQTISTLKIRFCNIKGCATAVAVPPVTTYALKYADVDGDGKILGQGLADLPILTAALTKYKGKLTPADVAEWNSDPANKPIREANAKTNNKLCDSSTNTEVIDYQCVGAIAAGWVTSPTPAYPVSTVYTKQQSGCP